MVRSTLDALDHLGNPILECCSLREACGDPYSRLQVNEDGAWDIARIIALFIFSPEKPFLVVSTANLVKEDVFAVSALGRKIFEIAILIDAMLLA